MKKEECRNPNCKEKLNPIKEDHKGYYYICPICEDCSFWIPRGNKK